MRPGERQELSTLGIRERIRTKIKAVGWVTEPLREHSAGAPWAPIRVKAAGADAF